MTHLQVFFAGAVPREQVVVIVTQQLLPLLKVLVQLPQEQLGLLLISQLEPLAQPLSQARVLGLHPLLKVHGGVPRLATVHLHAWHGHCGQIQLHAPPALSIALILTKIVGSNVLLLILPAPLRA